MKPNPEIGNDWHHPRPTASLRSRPARCGCSGLAGALLTALVLAAGVRANGQSAAYAFTNFVGQPGVAGTNDGVGSAARFNQPSGIAVDPGGNVFVADSANHVIRKVSPAGEVVAVAGNPGIAGTVDGTGAAARFTQPSAVAVDGNGNVFVADGGNSTIRQLMPAGTNWTVKTIAGKAGSRGNADGNGGVARFAQPLGLAVDSSGGVYVADTLNNTIRKVTPEGTNWVVTTLAGSAAQFDQPSGIVLGHGGDLLVADTWNHTIRRMILVGTNWVVSTVAGWGQHHGTNDGVGSTARFYNPQGLAMDSAGNVLVADTWNSTIRRLSQDGTNWVVTTVGGSAGTSGKTDGTGGAARFSHPSALAFDGAGVLYVADTYNHRVSRGTLASQPLILTVDPLPPGTAGTAYSVTLAATGGRAPYQWSVVSNSLPWELALDATSGAISGLPTEAFSAMVRVRVTGADTLFSEQAFTLTVLPSPVPRISTIGLLPPGAAGSPYTLALVANGGQSPYTWTIVTGELPTELSLTADGVIRGVPSGPATAAFTVRVVGGDGQSASKDFSLIIHPARVPADAYAWTNFVGQPGGAGTVDGSGLAARFYEPNGIVVDGAGNLFVADRSNLTIRKMTPGGIVTTIAGQPGGFGSADGLGLAAAFSYPTGVAADGAGHLFVADQYNNTIRKLALVGTNWLVTTLAGRAQTPGTADGSAGGARFSLPTGLAVDADGNVFVADRGNCTIRKVSPSGQVTTIAGSPGTRGNTDGAGSVAMFSGPSGVALDGAENVFVADTDNNSVRELTLDGTNWVVRTLAGSGSFGNWDGPGTVAQFRSPTGIAVDGSGNLFVADNLNHTIRKIAFDGTDWVVTTLAGNPSIQYVGQPGDYADGSGSAARFNRPFGLAIDPGGRLVVADAGNSLIRAVTADGAVTTLAGSAAHNGAADGVGVDARFNGPPGVAVDDQGNLFVADYSNNTIRRVTPDGVVTTIAGIPILHGSADGVGIDARFWSPWGVAADGTGNVFVADIDNATIRKLTPEGTNWVVTTLAGSAGNRGSADGVGGTARFALPAGLAVDSAGNVIVADINNHTIRRVTPAGVVTTLAGSAGNFGYADGIGTTALFWSPRGVAVDGLGNIVVADSGNNVIRQLARSGTNWVVSTLAGFVVPGYPGGGTADGLGPDARFEAPFDVAVDGTGRIYVADSFNHTIRLLTPAGTNWVATTIGGKPGTADGQDGMGVMSRFAWPKGIAVDFRGNLYVADTGNNRIAKGTPVRLPTIGFVLNGTQLRLSWPESFVGWSLEAQTNGLNASPGAAWFPVPGSATTNQWTIPFDLASPGVFFQLRQGP